MIRVYAFTEGLRDLPPSAEAGGTALERIELDGLTAVVGRGPEPEPIVHGRIVEALVERADAVLPVRFGEVVPDERALGRLVADRRGELLLGLERVRGSVEVGLRVRGDGAAADRIHRRLAAIALESRVRRAGDGELATAYLVPRDRLPAVQEVVARAVADVEAPTILCTGPWAPYSFVEAA